MLYVHEIPDLSDDTENSIGKGGRKYKLHDGFCAIIYIGGVKYARSKFYCSGL